MVQSNETLVREITTKWDDRKAEQIYTLRTFGEQPNGERYIRDECTGDSLWAHRIADHYGIAVPAVDEPTDNSDNADKATVQA